MQFKQIVYTSLAALDISEEQLASIHASARDLNGLDGITGLLVFNGTHFLQWIEGPPAAIDDLLQRLRRDVRHSGLEIREDRMTGERLFGDWAMKLVRVRSPFTQAREDVLAALPSAMPDTVRERIAGMADKISVGLEP